MNIKAKSQQDSNGQSVSFFENDFIDKILKRVLGTKLYRNPFFLFLGSFLVFWLPVYFLFLLDKKLGRYSKTNFLEDYAAYAQYFVGIPLLLIARNVLDHGWRNIQDIVVKSGILSGDKYEQYKKSCIRIREVAFSRSTTIFIVMVGYLMSLFWFIGELTNGSDTYHTYIVSGEWLERPTTAGLYIALISIPIYSLVIVYWFTKYASWVAFLWRLAKSEPKLIGHHIDRTGGLQFLSQPIAVFGIIIFAVGVVQVATTFYKIEVEGSALMSLQVMTAPIVYVIFAPLFFIVPFFFFTKQLYAARMKSIRELNQLGYRFDLLRMTHFDQKKDSLEEIEIFSPLCDLSGVYENVVKMKIWPLDLGSISRLFLSAIVPMLPLLSKFNNLPKPIKYILNIFGSDS